MTEAPTSPLVPRRRWRIGILLGVGVLVNYFDRISLSVAGPQIAQDFALSPRSLGVLLSAFFWSYALLQIPAGVLLDRYGVQRVGRVSVMLWAMASLLTAFAGGFGGILVARLLLGMAEAPSFPANAKAVSSWFPSHERGLSTAIFDAAAKFSNVIGVPLIAFGVVGLGWRQGYLLVGALNLAYGYAFWRIYRDPGHDPSLSSAERDYLAANGAATDRPPAHAPLATLRHLLVQRKMWGIAIGFAAYGYCFYFFLTWLPTYFLQSLGKGIVASAGYAAIPWACATLADLLVGGWMIDAFIARGYDGSRVRKIVLLVGMGMGLAVFGAAFASSAAVATIWISVALSGLAAAAPVAWSLPGLIAPQGAVGAAGAVMNFSNNALGAAAPLVTGFLVGTSGSFVVPFLVAGGVLVVGLLAFGWLMGSIEPMPELPAWKRSRTR
jgi:MFS transporter, ACS family, D-galactonate transporter